MTKYKKVTPEIAAQLQAIVGAKRFFAGDAVKDDFSHDEMPIYGKYYPEVVCEAESTEEVSAILRVCYENDIPVTPRGAGTGLVGGCVPLCGGVVLCTTRMNKILSYDMNNLVVHIQPGVLLCDLAADALTRGVQVNGKLRGEILVPAEAAQAEIEAAALANPDVQRFTEGMTVRKIIIVKNKLVNVVVAK